MADTPTPTPAQLLADSIPNDVHQALMQQTQSLAHKHVTVSYLLIAVLLFVLSCGGVGAYFAAKWVDRALARAEKSEQLYLADKKVSDQAISDLKGQLADSEKARAASDQKIADLQKSITSIQTNANNQIQNALKPGKTASEAYADVKSVYKDKISTPVTIVESPDKTEQLLAFRVPDVQQFTAAKIDDDAQKLIVIAKDGVIAEKQTQIDGLKSDLAKSNDALGKLQVTEAQEHDALEKYKKVAKKTKWQKILGGMKTGVEIGGAIVFGYEIGHLGHK